MLTEKLNKEKQYVINAVKQHSSNEHNEEVNNECCEICKKCGGTCCKNTGCALIPADLPDDDIKDIDSIRKLLMSGKYSLDYYYYDHDSEDDPDPSADGELYFIRIRNKHAPVADYAYTGNGCVLLTETGCSLDYKHRPTQGQMLTPVDDEFGCEEGLKKIDVALMWSDYNDMLAELWNEFREDLTKGIPQDELENMIVSSMMPEDFKIDGVALCIPADNCHRSLLILTCGNANTVYEISSKNEWAYFRTETIYNVSQYDKHILYGPGVDIADASERIYHWMYLGYLADSIWYNDTHMSLRAMMHKIDGFVDKSMMLDRIDVMRNLDNVHCIDECQKSITRMKEMGFNPILIHNYELLVNLELMLFERMRSEPSRVEEFRIMMRMVVDAMYHARTSHDRIPFGLPLGGYLG